MSKVGIPLWRERLICAEGAFANSLRSVNPIKSQITICYNLGCKGCL